MWVSKRGVSPSSQNLPLSFEGEALPLGALAQRGDTGGEVTNNMHGGMEIVYQPLTLFPSPLMKGRGKEFLKGAKPLLIPGLKNLKHKFLLSAWLKW